MNVTINKPVSMGTLPGSVPPALAWHRFEIHNDSGVVEHFIDDVKRAEISTENFAEYIDKNPSVIGLVVSVEKTPSVMAAVVDDLTKPQ